MKVIGYILIVCAAIVVGFFLYVSIETIYRFVSGKMSKDEIERLLAADRREKERKRELKRQRKAQKALYNCPSPLETAMGRGAGSSLANKTFTINIELNKV